MVQSERVTGSLAAAETAARRLLPCSGSESDLLALRIELAAVLDRIGLHTNSRPVTEALEILRSAEATIADESLDDRAAIALALAGYFYRAEMSERTFAIATDYAREAEQLYGALNDPVGECDAVHRLGLIEFQKRNLEAARLLFDRSLELSQEGPDRPIFLSDYHRHIGFVEMLSGDLEKAIGHFERSLAYRDEANSRDYGLFARTMLASALIDAGRASEAEPYLDQALRIAAEIPSPVGELRATYGLARMSEALGEKNRAKQLYIEMKKQAAALGISRYEKAANEGVARLAAEASEGPGR